MKRKLIFIFFLLLFIFFAISGSTKAFSRDEAEEKLKNGEMYVEIIDSDTDVVFAEPRVCTSSNDLYVYDAKSLDFPLNFTIHYYIEWKGVNDENPKAIATGFGGNNIKCTNAAVVIDKSGNNSASGVILCHIKDRIPTSENGIEIQISTNKGTKTLRVTIAKSQAAEKLALEAEKKAYDEALKTAYQNPPSADATVEEIKMFLESDIKNNNTEATKSQSEETLKKWQEKLQTFSDTNPELGKDQVGYINILSDIINKRDTTSSEAIITGKIEEKEKYFQSVIVKLNRNYWGRQN